MASSVSIRQGSADGAAVRVGFSYGRLLSFLGVGKAWETGPGRLRVDNGMFKAPFFHLTLKRHYSVTESNTPSIRLRIIRRIK